MGIKQLIDDFNVEWPEAQTGPGRAVLVAPNWGDDTIKHCIALLRHVLLGEYVSVEDRDFVSSQNSWKDHNVLELGATLNLLTKILFIPESERATEDVVSPVDPPFNYEEPTDQ